MKKTGINSRSLTSLISFASFLIMTVTGLVLYFVPQGRVAYWVHWEFIGFSKTEWGNVHIISSIVFAIAGIFHLYLNWKPFMNYIAGKMTGSLKFKRELAIASVISLLVLLGSIYLFPPFNYVIDFSEYLKSAWVISKDHEPPFGHAEEVSLKTFSKKMDIHLEEAVGELKAQGIVFSSVDEKLDDIARANNIRPMDIYKAIKKFEPQIVAEGTTFFTSELVDEKFAGTGIGRKKLSWLLEDIGMDRELAGKRLRKNNLALSDDETLKEAAERCGIDPIDILKIILVENYRIH